MGEAAQLFHTLKGCSISGFIAHTEGITVSLYSIGDLASSKEQLT
jgi:hypothetical protein